MPKGPRGERRPADVIGNAVHVMRIATGQVEEKTPASEGKESTPEGGARGRKGASNSVGAIQTQSYCKEGGESALESAGLRLRQRYKPIQESPYQHKRFHHGIDESVTIILGLPFFSKS